MQACPDLAITLTRLQRAGLYRARSAVFSAIGSLGGVPSEAEEAEREAADAQVRVHVAGALARAVAESHPGHVPFARLAPEQRSYWEIRGPAVAGFGFSTCRMLSRFGTVTDGDGAGALVAALFQLAASYVDWLADDVGHSREIAEHLSVETVRGMAYDRAVRHAVVDELRRSASVETAEFAVLLSTLFDLIDRLPSPTRDLRDLVWRSYAAELASFRPADPSLDLIDVAYAKSVTPTLVVGELARLHVRSAERATVWDATLAMGPVFGFVDDVQDLSRDLRQGDINGLYPASRPLTDAETCDAIEAVLRGDELERAAAEVVTALDRIDRMLAVHPDAVERRTAVLVWLRVLIWRWLA